MKILYLAAWTEPRRTSHEVALQWTLRSGTKNSLSSQGATSPSVLRPQRHVPSR